MKANWNQPVEILDLRHFVSADLRDVLEEESKTWERELFWDYTQSTEMILRYVDARILPGYVAMERGRVHGYAFFVYEGGKGVIGDLYVLRRNRSGTPGAESEVEQRLLKHVLETLQRSPGIHRIEAQLLLHPAGGLSESFLDEGFRRYQRLFMLLPLKAAAASQPPKRIPKEIQLRRWSEGDYQQAAALITACYRGHIDSEINDQYRSNSGSLRFLNNIVRFPGCGIFDAASSFVAIHRPTNSMLGLILCSRVRADVGHITQVCVLPEFRGHGIGEILLEANSTELQRRNFSLLSLTVTEANTGAVELYRRLGYSVNRMFDAFVWEG